jgi:hypothetical protein
VRTSILRLSLLGSALALTVCPVLSETLKAPNGLVTLHSPDGLVTLQGIAKPTDSISPSQLAHIRSVVAEYEKQKAAQGTRSEDTVPFLYPFFPQSGIQGQDLFLSNFTDQDDRSGPAFIRDWDCSEYTYDGHEGHDSLIRSFREQAIGVPAYAVLPGRVVDTHDGEPDMNTVWDDANQANYVIIDHGGGYVAWYFHFRKGSIVVSPGQIVTAGTQLGLTGSSGLSNWPHLHFQTQKNARWVEPSSGPCHQGDSLWVSQPPVNRDFAANGFYLAHSPVQIPDRESWLLDADQRTGTFVKGVQTVGVRIDVHNLPANPSFDFRLLNPHGQVVDDIPGSFATDGVFEVSVLNPWFNVDLDPVGTWRFQAVVADSLIVDAPFKVVATAKQVVNRAPSRVTAHFSPLHPVAGQALACVVQTPLVLRDPDFDIVSYRYEWRLNNHVVRTVTSAGLMDFLAAGLAQPKDKVTCRVTPTDGKLSAAVATVNGVVAAP